MDRLLAKSGRRRLAHRESVYEQKEYEGTLTPQLLSPLQGFGEGDRHRDHVWAGSAFCQCRTHIAREAEDLSEKISCP